LHRRADGGGEDDQNHGEHESVHRQQGESDQRLAGDRDGDHRLAADTVRKLPAEVRGDDAGSEGE
jgi:hypothetical protein